MEEKQLDGIVLAAAGFNRLSLKHPHAVVLPVDRFVPAPGQGALAVQGREGSLASSIAAALDHADTRRAVTAERRFLHDLGAGCHTPAGALATTAGKIVSLHGQLFSEDGKRCVGGVEKGKEPESIGGRLAKRLLEELGQ
jgi:hydroxymethylbilane synthase